MDLPDIMIVVQWGATCSISTLWQRFGRCVRDPNLQGTAVLFSAKENFDPERQKKVERAEKRRANAALKKQGAKRPKVNTSTFIKTEEEVVELEYGDEETKEKENGMNDVTVMGNSKRTVDSFVDSLINAESRGTQCRHAPFMAAFKNNEAGE